jgi:transcription-repair coupling factor (superfamily II helicase)
MAERLATLNALQVKQDKPQLLVATASAATQRLLTPFRIRQLTRRIAEGERIERELLVQQLNALGYQRADTVAEHGEYAVRGSLIDLFPAGEELALRLDFFGDEIDSIRRFDPADQRSTDKAEAFTLMPASEALLDVESIKRFRSRYREQFGATATQDPLYQALSEGRRMAGMEHWLPLLEERLETLFDHLGENDLVIRDSAADQALESRRDSIEDYYQNRGRWRASRAATGRWRHTRSISPKRNGKASKGIGRSTSPRPSPSQSLTWSSISGFRRRAISLPSERSRPTSTRRSQNISGTCAEAATRSCSRVTRVAPGSDSPA